MANTVRGIGRQIWTGVEKRAKLGRDAYLIGVIITAYTKNFWGIPFALVSAWLFQLRREGKEQRAAVAAAGLQEQNYLSKLYKAKDYFSSASLSARRIVRHALMSAGLVTHITGSDPEIYNLTLFSDGSNHVEVGKVPLILTLPLSFLVDLIGVVYARLTGQPDQLVDDLVEASISFPYGKIASDLLASSHWGERRLVRQYLTRLKGANGIKFFDVLAAMQASSCGRSLTTDFVEGTSMDLDWW